MEKSEFQKQPGFVVSIVWKHKCSKLIEDYFNEKARSLSTTESHYKLTIYIDIDETLITNLLSAPKIYVEGKIEDDSGNLEAAFSEIRMLGVGSSSNIKKGVDTMISHIETNFIARKQNIN